MWEPEITVVGSASGVGGALVEFDPGTGVVFAAAIALAVVHLLAGGLRAIDRIPRSGWLSFGGGISVAYVFVHLFPELQERGEILEESDLFVAAFFEHHVYLVALTGFAVFYGLERLVTRSRQDDAPFGVSLPAAGVFWIHIGSFALYNGIIGYLLHDRAGPTATVLFAVAMGVHFVVNDASLREDHEHRYHDVGRWVLSFAVVVGAAIGAFFEVGEALVAVLVAFLAGGIILNVIKEELPENFESRWWAFAVGAAGYTAVLLLV